MSALALPQRNTPHTLLGVAFVRLRYAPWGFLLALLALMTMSAVSTWHNASIHDDDAIHAVSIAHEHEKQDSSDPDGAVHLTAHMVGQSLAVPDTAVAHIYEASFTTNWSVPRSALKAGIDPTSLLRPPKA
ncbi:MAG: hypothetical protein B7Y38_11645 [Sphingomonadales bacterium 28-56-43]|nr:MAG: hypothetical protein B7Y38_11645 [Sphingomonadales bacterium 28-56-43]